MKLPLPLLLLLLLSSCSTILVSPAALSIPPKTVVLTFDDGPNSSFNTTARLLEVLEKHHVKAYFCLIGANAEKHPEIVKSIFAKGHTIVCHDYTDRQIYFRSNGQIVWEIAKFAVTLNDILGPTYTLAYYRPPYGIYRPSTNRIIASSGLQLMPVSMYALDAEVKPESKGKIFERLLTYVEKHNKAILILHDGKDGCAKMEAELKKNPDTKYNREWVPQVVDSLITRLSAENYKFVTLDKYQ
jgi:peptidoglycan-N-acetylglucosamine deacetylase